MAGMTSLCIYGNLPFSHRRSDVGVSKLSARLFGLEFLRHEPLASWLLASLVPAMLPPLVERA